MNDANLNTSKTDAKSDVLRATRARMKETVLLAINSFSKTEKIVFCVLVALAIFSAFMLSIKANSLLMADVPSRGGELVEGIVGTPRFVNPLLAVTDADKDLSILLYSGLMRVKSDGTLEPDLAESYSVSEDGLVYSFLMKEGLVWSDGQLLTAEDVVFTVEKAKDPGVRSGKRANWEGVEVSQVSPREVHFTLKNPYSLFLENTTIGILPKHIWGTLSADEFAYSSFNMEPVGSGPYRIKKIKQTNSGIPAYYELEPFRHFSLGEPFIQNLKIQFFANEEELFLGLKKGDVHAASGITPGNVARFADAGATIVTVPLPRIFGVFFNQNEKELFADKAVREALNVSAPKTRIVEEVMKGYATVIDSPLPPGSNATSSGESLGGIEEAAKILVSAGWVKNAESGLWEKKKGKVTEVLEFSISTTGSAPELTQVAEMLRTEWEALGARVEIKIFEVGDLNQNVIRARKYDALLFGEIVGRDPDLFAFWHSSQRFDPGLNIALYANITADTILEEARKISDPIKRGEMYRQFASEIKKDVPAIFLYSPSFIYAVPKDLRGVELPPLVYSGERFSQIHRWYISTEKVWKIFQ